VQSEEGRFEVARVEDGAGAMEVDGGEWVVDTFVRTESGNGGATVADDEAEKTKRVDWLWGDDEWEDGSGEDEDRVDTDDEDSNAEDYYGADYPEDEDDDLNSSNEDGDSEDEFDREYLDESVADYDDHFKAMSYR